MKDTDEGKIREQEAAIDLVLDYMEVQIKHLSVIVKEMRRVKEYMEMIKMLLDNVKHPTKDYHALEKAVREKLQNL